MGPTGMIVSAVECTDGRHPYVCDWCFACVTKIIHCRIPDPGLLCVGCSHGLVCYPNAIYIVSTYGYYIYEDFTSSNVEGILRSMLNMNLPYREYLGSEFSKFALTKL